MGHRHLVEDRVGEFPGDAADEQEPVAVAQREHDRGSGGAGRKRARVGEEEVSPGDAGVEGVDGEAEPARALGLSALDEVSFLKF